MQRGSLAIVTPKEGPAVWQFRWSEKGFVEFVSSGREQLARLSDIQGQHLARHATKKTYQAYLNRWVRPHRLSTLRSTLDVYTQAITPAKHAAQAAVLSLVFAPESNGTAQLPISAETCSVMKPCGEEEQAKRDKRKDTKTCPFGSSMV